LTAFLYSAGYATGGLLVILLAVILEGIRQRRVPWRRTPLDFLVIAFVSVSLLSGYLSEYRGMAIASTGIAALTIYLAFGASARVLRRDAGALRPVLWMWVIGGALTAIWAISIYVSRGDAASTPGLGKNAVGTTMVITALVALGLIYAERSRLRYLGAGIAVLASAALLLTYVRGAWLGVLAGLILLILFGGRKLAWTGLALIVAIWVPSVALTGRGHSQVVARALGIINPEIHQSRIFLLKSAVWIFTEHPVLGTGMNTFPLVYPHYRLPGDVNPVDARPNAHNIVLNTAAEGGLVGLVVFVAILAQTFRMGWKWRAAAPTEGDRALRTSVLAALAGILVHQVFDGTLISVHLGAGMWMLMAILASSPS
jgi:O-antigen ligase